MCTDHLDHKHTIPAQNTASVGPSASSVTARVDALLPSAAPKLLMAVQLQQIIDSTLTAELALNHPAAQAYAKAHGKANGLTETELQILQHGAVCTRIVNGAMCGTVLVAPESRLAKLRLVL
jgi:hypothetical protein